VDSSSRCHARGNYCTAEFFDNSTIKFRLIRAESAAKEIHPRGKLRFDFRPGFCARLTLTVRFHRRDFHLRVSILPSRASRPNRPSLARILTTDLHCLKSVPPIPTVLSYRGSLSRALTTRYFFFFFFYSDKPGGRKRAISIFPTIKELSQSASYTSIAISLISTVIYLSTSRPQTNRNWTYIYVIAFFLPSQTFYISIEFLFKI